MESHFHRTVSVSHQERLAENEQLRRRVIELEDQLHESEETMRAIRQGEVDAFVVGEDAREMQVHALLAADRHYLHLAQRAVNVAIWDWDLVAEKFSHCRRLPEILGSENLSDRMPEELLLLVHPEDRDRVQSRLREVLSSRESASAYEEFRIVGLDGHQRWLVSVAQLTEDPMSGGQHLIGVCLDVTGRKSTELALHASEVRLRAVMDNAPSMIYIVDAEQRFHFINRRWGEVFGLTNEQVAGRTLYDFFPKEVADKFAENNRDVLQKGRPQEFEEVVPQADGDHTYLSAKVPLSDTAGTPSAICGISVDITRRKQAEEALRQSEDRLRSLNESLESQIEQRTVELVRQTQQLRRLASELTDVEQRERDKLAQVLHDGLQQMLVGIKMQLPLCTGEDAQQQLKRIAELLDETIDMSRSLAYELSPPILHAEGLREALEWLAGWFVEKHRFEVHVDAAEDLPSLPDNTRVILFHAVRELLLNAVKHSGVDEAWIVVRATADRFGIEVCDEGRGFDPPDLEQQDQPQGMGLFSIRERLRALGGTLEITSSPGATRFILALPHAPVESRDGT